MPGPHPGTSHALHNPVTAQTVLAFLSRYISGEARNLFRPLHFASLYVFSE